MIPFSRVEVGPRFSEGARLLWRVLKAKGWSQGDIRDDLEAPAGVVHRWLYGDHRPSLTWCLALEKRYGIPASAWVQKPTRPFSFPAVAAA